LPDVKKGPDAEKGCEELKRLWEEVVRISIDELDTTAFIDDEQLLNKIRLIIRSNTMSYKYALLTQLLAKLVDPHLNALALQKKARLPGSFDARSFCKNTIVRFERSSLRNVLGGSHDPYVSKPLRHEAVSLAVINEIKDKDGWRVLHDVLKAVQDRNNRDFTRSVLKQALLEVRRLLIEVLTSRDFSISKPPTLMELMKAIQEFLSEPSEGARAQAVVYALMCVINRRLNVFKNIETTKATVADRLAGKLADIECRGENGAVKVGISVTEALDSNKLEEELDKSAQKGVRKLILLAHEIRPDPRFHKIRDHYMRTYNLDVVIENIISFTSIFVTLLNDNMREEFIREVANVLKNFGYQKHLIAWINTLKDMGIITVGRRNST